MIVENEYIEQIENIWNNNRGYIGFKTLYEFKLTNNSSYKMMELK